MLPARLSVEGFFEDEFCWHVSHEDVHSWWSEIEALLWHEESHIHRWHLWSEHCHVWDLKVWFTPLSSESFNSSIETMQGAFNLLS
jgi:hypothetical protein